MANETPIKSVPSTLGYASAFASETEFVGLSGFRSAYHELAESAHVVETDSLEQLKRNIASLEELHGRLKYMMSEISGLLKQG
jgi:hypothetical protein